MKRRNLFLILFLGILIHQQGCIYRRAAPQPPPAPVVIGVSEGRTYPKDVIIDIMPMEGVEISASIDGRPYELGTSYSVEGAHDLLLIATSTTNRLTSKKEVHFIIDKKPPPVPALRNIIDGKTYFESINIDVISVAGVDYKIEIDGEAFPLGEKYDVIGEHTLVIEAEKKSNGLKSSSQIHFTLGTLEEKYLDYFLEIALGSEYNGGRPVVKKWMNDLRIKVEGTPSSDDMNTLEEVVKEINELSLPVRLRFVERTENVKIHFIPESDFYKWAPEYIPTNEGFFTTWQDANNVIYKGKVLVTTEGISQKERSHLIREEVTQILGLINDSWKYSDSIFFQGWTEITEYAQIDKKLIKMLYRKDVRAGMTGDKVISLFEKSPMR